MIRVRKGRLRGRVVVAKAGDQSYKRLHAIADKYLRAMAQALQKTTEELQSQLTLEQLEEAVRHGAAALIVNQIDWAAAYEEPLLAEWRPLLTQLIDEAGVEAVETLKFKMRFDLLNPHSVDWIRNHAAELVREVTEGTKQAVRSIIDEAFRYGRHPKQQARLIRNLVGLTERQSMAVQRRWIAWREDPALAHLTDEQIDRRVERYARKLHRMRAETIARTETMTAANQGQALAVAQAEAAGLVDAERARRVWILTPDDRLCDFCAQMDGAEVGLHEDFETPLGSMPHPPMHPRCRCAWGLRFMEVPR